MDNVWEVMKSEQFVNDRDIVQIGLDAADICEAQWGDELKQLTPDERRAWMAYICFKTKMGRLVLADDEFPGDQAMVARLAARVVHIKTNRDKAESKTEEVASTST